MEGLLDWYFLGVAIALGTALGGIASAVISRPVPAAVGIVVLGGIGAALALVEWWLPIAMLAAALIGALFLRQLSLPALQGAVLALVLAAWIPALGYLAALAAPVLGQRLRRRAGERYAGLRVLARE
ncbi:MAG: hypothetical protein M3312_02445 [Actinomycetota bacterium]|nr:hypothetical protein [Actinomycetota bacterium]